jgi:Fur family ferric uptake transcriptional regulator
VADEATIHGLIRRAGGRLTGPTRSVVSILLAAERHLTAEDLIAEVTGRSRGIAPSTVYRVLQRLDELGILGHVHSGVGAAFYHLRSRPHAHLVCTLCGTVIDVPTAAFEQLSEASRTSYDFTIEPHHSAVLGRCGSCTP